MWRRISLCVASVAGISLLAACGGDVGSSPGNTALTKEGDGGSTASAGDSGGTSIDLESATAAANLTDAEVLQVLIDASAGNTGIGILVSRCAQNPAVKTFAGEMATEHMTNEKRATELAGTLGISPADSAIAERLRSDAANTQAELTATSPGPEFDRLYLQEFSSQHGEFLGCLDRMIETTDSPDIRMYLADRRDEAEGDLRAGTSLLMTMER
ncbi:MAG TPA: DUF4142 domain-containing protein [Polyangiaceae bacterium]|nr:DUF4142 domain-containing protein [Polyangiaceae bacterium]